LRKFRFKFLDYEQKTGKEHCQSFIKEIGRFFEIVEHGSQSNDDKCLLKSSMDESTEQMSTLSIKDLVGVLLEKNESKLPLFYQNQKESELIKDEKALEEFIVSTLLDPQFPSFVNKVEKSLADLINSEIKNSSS
jgi:hypothetical protein